MYNLLCKATLYRMTPKRGDLKMGRGIGNKGFTSLLELLVTLIVISILFYLAFKFYFNKPVRDKEMDKTLSTQGIDTSTYQSTVSSTKKKLSDINQQASDRFKDADLSR